VWGEERPRACGDPGGGWSTPRVHPKHVAHVCDAGCVETQRLVERPRVLPSQKEDIRSERHAGREAGGRGTAAAQATCRGGPNCGDRGQGTPERTRNMSLMFVTLDVSKLSGWLNTDAPCRVEERTYKVGSMRAGMREGV